MQFPNEQQFFDSIGKSYKILIALPENPNADTLGSALALAAFLRKLNKEVEIFCEKNDFGNLSFLPNIQWIKSQIAFSETFVISVDTTKTKIDEISYHQLDDQVNINIKPQSGVFTSTDVSFGSEKLIPDLIICVDTPSLEHLGELYSKNAEMFFNTPRVNIDNHLGNENYGNINIVDITVSSTSEILLELIKTYEASLIDGQIATCLLAGIISSTNSFQHASTTPASFMRASELISYGADQQQIIRHLFKTKSLSMLKLLGRSMARIKNIQQFDSVFTAVSSQDLEKSEANQEDILKAVLEFTKSISDAKLIFFAVERESFVELYIYANPNIKFAEVINHFGGQLVFGTLARAEIKNASIAEAENIVSQALAELKPRIGL
jgi:nanoRNase/pAp phosphatase (c-di-AMP/oligoRNAs hydrolase)